MKICEYENIMCPSCGETKEKEEGTNHGLKEIDRGEFIGAKDFRGPMHIVHCFSCSISFGITCED